MLKSEVLELVPQLCLFSVAEVSGGDIEALKVPLVSFSATVEWLMVFSGTKMVEGDVIVTSEMPERLMFSGLLCSPEVKVLVLLMLVESVVPVGLEFSGVMWVLLPGLVKDWVDVVDAVGPGQQVRKRLTVRATRCPRRWRPGRAGSFLPMLLPTLLPTCLGSAPHTPNEPQ